jgi:hypothetical protein
MPTPRGLVGATSVADGVYFRTAVTYYEQADNGPDSSQFQGMIIISGNTVRQWNRPLPDPESHFDGTFQVNGTNLIITAVCPAQMIGMTQPLPFTYENGVFKNYDMNGKKESVFTRQP